MKKLILSAVVAAAAVFGAYTANQTSNEVASLGLLDASAIEAEGFGPGDGGSVSGTAYYPYSNNGVVEGEISLQVTISTEDYVEFEKKRQAGIAIGPLVEWLNVSGSISSGKKNSNKNTGTVTVSISEKSYVYPCVGKEGASCTPYHTNSR